MTSYPDISQVYGVGYSAAINKTMFAFKVDGLSSARSILESKWPTLSDPHPTLEMVCQILDFTADLTDEDRVLVNCHLGQTRSSAIMIGILMQHGMEARDAFAAVLEARPAMMPNVLFCEHIDTYFALNGELRELATKHMRDELAATRIMAAQPSAQSESSVNQMQSFLDLFKD